MDFFATSNIKCKHSVLSGYMLKHFLPRGISMCCWAMHSECEKTQCKALQKNPGNISCLIWALFSLYQSCAWSAGNAGNLATILRIHASQGVYVCVLCLSKENAMCRLLCGSSFTANHITGGSPHRPFSASAAGNDRGSVQCVVMSAQ